MPKVHGLVFLLTPAAIYSACFPFAAPALCLWLQWHRLIVRAAWGRLRWEEIARSASRPSDGEAGWPSISFNSGALGYRLAILLNEHPWFNWVDMEYWDIYTYTVCQNGQRMYPGTNWQRFKHAKIMRQGCPMSPASVLMSWIVLNVERRRSKSNFLLSILPCWFA